MKKKPYKTALPEDTIYNIRKILHQVGINVTEQHFRKDGMYYSCRVYVDNNNIRNLDIGTNGKGMSSIYSLASAYGELMERLQNKMLMVATKYAAADFAITDDNTGIADVPQLKFRYFPDEKVKNISGEELAFLCSKYLPNCSDIGFSRECEYSVYYADFYNTTSHSVESVPYTLLRFAASSTGLCAGNSPEEAILQGLNEIFERYVLQQIYLKKLTPPTIPIEMFDGTDVGSRLRKLQAETKWDIKVKDCSLGQGFPVLGLLLIDRNKNRYSFRLGADLSPEIALQRCFTEAFQGTSVSDKYMRPIILDSDWDIKAEHNQSVINGCGQYPKEIFSDIADWEFTGFKLKGRATHAEDLKMLCEWLATNGYTLYLRDNSFLGFPAYHLYIPRLSDIDSQLYDIGDEIERYNKNFNKIKDEYRIPSLSKDEISSFVSKYRHKPDKVVSLFPYNSGAYKTFNRLLLLALLSYKSGNDADAYLFMKAFLRQKETEGLHQNPYYYCVRDLFYLNSLKNDRNIISILENIYSKPLVTEVIEDMADRDNVLSNLPLSNCFNCDKCKIKNTCCYKDIVNIENNIQKKQIDNKLSQIKIAELFE